MPAEAQPPVDIQSLTARMARGDEGAWREFYDLYFNRLLRYLLVATAGREDAAREALQQTLLRAVKYIRRFESEPVFWSWLTVLARSALVDEGRKRSRYLALLDRFLQRQTHDSGPPDDDADARLVALLERNIGGLEDSERELVGRKYFAGDTVREIADELQTTEKAIESRLTRVRRKLKGLILAQLKDES